MQIDSENRHFKELLKDDDLEIADLYPSLQ